MDHPPRRRLAVAVLAALLALVLAQATGRLRDPDVGRGHEVVVNLFQWPWRSVASECQWVGAQGYGGVQVSPAQEHVVVAGSPWWVDYQPVSYRIESRRGSRAEFAAMVTACHDAGVRVYADAVINHMAGGDSGVGSAGTAWTHYDYPGTWGPQAFHHCGIADQDDIADYSNRDQVQSCELVNLADLATEQEPVRAGLAAYLRDLVSLGVDGFRVDAAKHVPAADLAAVLERVATPARSYLEVIDKGGEPITAAEYVGIGDVLVFTYGDEVGNAFQRGRIADLAQLGGPVASDVALVFLDNHDTQRHGGPAVVTHANPAAYRLATVFMLAWPYGKPVVMSSYAFDDPDAGPPADPSTGRTDDAVCGRASWVCEHRWPAIAGMVGFHDAVAGTGVARWWDDGANAIAFARGDKGYVVVNNGRDPLAGRSFETGLPPGLYCDVVHGALTNGACTGPSITVSDTGWFTADVAATDAIALHVGARLS